MQFIKVIKQTVDFIKKLNILLVSRHKEHCQQRRMAIPEDKEWERKWGVFRKSTSVCHYSVLFWLKLWLGLWKLDHLSLHKGTFARLSVVWSDLELTPPVPCPWHDSKRNSGYSAHHSPLFSWLLQKSRESCLRCILEHVSDIQISIRRQILVNYKALRKSAQRFKMCLPANGQSSR